MSLMLFCMLNQGQHQAWLRYKDGLMEMSNGGLLDEKLKKYERRMIWQFQHPEPGRLEWDQHPI